jgi:hypothetical protein
MFKVQSIPVLNSNESKDYCYYSDLKTYLKETINFAKKKKIKTDISSDPKESTPIQQKVI